MDNNGLLKLSAYAEINSAALNKYFRIEVSATEFRDYGTSETTYDAQTGEISYTLAREDMDDVPVGQELSIYTVLAVDMDVCGVEEVISEATKFTIPRPCPELGATTVNGVATSNTTFTVFTPVTQGNLIRTNDTYGYMIEGSVTIHGQQIPTPVTFRNNSTDATITLTNNTIRADVSLAAIYPTIEQLMAAVNAYHVVLTPFIYMEDSDCGTNDTIYGVPTIYRPCPDMTTVTDIEGNIYNTVKIGNQCWMRENLRTKHYADNTPLTDGGTSFSEQPIYYNNTASDLSPEQRGLLYNWPAVMNGESSSEANPSGVQGICPEGWHVPSKAEFDALISYVSSQSEFVCGSNNGNIAKALASQEGWESSTTDCAVGNNPELNNATGFSAFPAGMLDSSNEFSVDISEAAFWTTSSTPANPLFVYYYHLTNYRKDFIYPQTTKNYGMSVRCVRNN